MHAQAREGGEGPGWNVGEGYQEGVFLKGSRGGSSGGVLEEA